MTRCPLICIVGPTGAGKTAVSLPPAQALDGVVVNCDSRQLYADFPIITAQPNEEERAKAPHRLYGLLDIDESWGAAAYAEAAAAEIDLAHHEGKLPNLVGGTGFYLRALLDPLAPIPDVPVAVREEVTDEYLRLGGEVMHAKLSSVDPEGAARIHPNDKQRVIRGLEVHRATGKPLSHWQSLPTCPNRYNALKIGVTMPKDALKERLARRITIMLDHGAVEEAKAAYAKNSDPDAPGWSGIGCAELYSYITGELTREQTEALWFKNTKAYAKRQLTWFKADRQVRWVEPSRSDDVLESVKKFLHADKE